MPKGRVIKLVGGLYKIYDLQTREQLEAKATGRLRAVVVDASSSFNKQITHKTKLETKTIKQSPKVGDIVLYEETYGKNMITDIFPRKNELDRPPLTNVDQVLLIFSCVKPDFSFHLLDIFLILVEKAQVQPIIVITKIDLLAEQELDILKSKLNYYERIGYQVFYVNSKTTEGFQALRAIFRDKITVLTGQTGAGKSTFINALIPGFKLQTQEISTALGRGKHTTRHCELFLLDDGFIGDTPGFSKLDLSLINPEELKSYFKEFDSYECKYRGCLHLSEPQCSVKEAVSANEMLKERYQSYEKIITELKNTMKKY